MKNDEEKTILHRDSDSKLNIQLETCLDKAKEELEQLHEPKVRAAVLRSKAQYYEGEKPTKFFCNLEKISVK